MSVNLSPIGNGITFLDNTGQPLAGGLLYTYQAGTSTPLTTYSDYNGIIANTNPIVLGSDGRLPSELWLQSGYNYKLVLKDSTGTLLATWDNIYGIIGTVPAAPSAYVTGMIMLWAGAIGSIPSGWNLCDGTNGSPDLRDRFIVGAGTSYSVGATGGTADAIVVSHTHTATSTSVVTDPGHLHNIPNALGGSPNGGSPYIPGAVNPGSGLNTASNTTGITVATTTTNQSTGTSGTGQNLPPYYALCYIYKM